MERVYDSPMAFIAYVPPDRLAPEEQVADPDNIIQIHAIHPSVMRQHYELYKQLMHRAGPLTRRERELLGVRVSALNHCRY
jgi:alkylhydroperoxidase family enzyme